jgi:GTP:adenosylcobinamide-phosphate guanylyltransferase
MDALVTAGGTPAPGEPLYEAAEGRPKALIDIAGKPMAQWVLDALGGASRVDRVVLVGVSSDSGLTCAKPIEFVPNQGSMLSNIKAGMDHTLKANARAHHVLAVSSDIPGITPEMVDWTVDTTMQTDDDLYYSVIERATMESRYPGSKRSYVRLKDVEVCGGDMNVIRATLAGNEGLWERLVAARKNAMKQAALVGLDVLFLVLIGQLPLHSAESRISKRLKLRGRVVLCPFAEIGMDVDKPFQLELMRQDLASRRSSLA